MSGRLERVDAYETMCIDGELYLHASCDSSRCKARFWLPLDRVDVGSTAAVERVVDRDTRSVVRCPLSHRGKSGWPGTAPWLLPVCCGVS